MKIKFIIYLIIILTSGFLLSAHSQDEIPEDVPIISYGIFPKQYESDEQFSHLLGFLKEYPDSVDEIALMDENFPAPAGLQLEAVEKLAERLEKRRVPPQQEWNFAISCSASLTPTRRAPVGRGLLPGPGARNRAISRKCCRNTAGRSVEMQVEPHQRSSNRQRRRWSAP